MTEILRVYSEQLSHNRVLFFLWVVSRMGKKVLSLTDSTYYSANTSHLVYDGIVNRTGCTGAEDTLACLRTVDFDTLKAAFNISAEFVWLPRTDGSFFSDFPQHLVSQGKVANIPLITSVLLSFLSA